MPTTRDLGPNPAADGQNSTQSNIFNAEPQIATVRYYAGHLLGDLKDPRAVPILVQLLSDEEVNYIVPWSLAEIGDKRAVAPLFGTLADKNPAMRVLAIYALEKLGAKDALPALACATAAQTHLIVSGDKDLLDLHEHKGIPILPAATALQRIEAK